jgi:hypothetical protein
MAYTTEQLAEFAAKAAQLRSEAHKFELEQQSLKEYGSKDGDRFWLLGVEIRRLRDEAKRIYAPVLDAEEKALKNKP